MSQYNFMDKIRSFLGIYHQPPRNDFRNPIWSSDDEDDGDELYTRQPMEMETFDDVFNMQQEFTRQMHDMLQSFGDMFADMKSFIHEGPFDSFASVNPMLPEGPESESFSGNNLRDYYLKPGFHNHRQEEPRDVDLDGKISSNEISGLLKQNKDVTDSSAQTPRSLIPFGNLIPGRSFCQTIITTSVTKPDGTVETRRIIKNGNELIEETTTSTPDARGPHPGLDQMSSPGMIYNHVMSELGSLFRNYH